MPLAQWSTTPANNGSGVTNVNMLTGSAPSTVHPSIRQMMADVATWYASAEWLAQADVPTYSSATVFTVPGDRRSVYSVNRRVQATGTGYTINGTISVSAYTSLTTVTVVWDSGSLDATVTAVGVGILQSQLAHMTITGGTIDGAVIGGTTPAAGSFTTLSATGAITGAGLSVTGATVPANGIYLPSANTVGFATASTSRGSVNATGNWSLAAPSSGTTVSIAGVPGASTATYINANAAAVVFVGAYIENLAANGYAAAVLKSNGLSKYFRVDSAGTFQIINNANSAVLCQQTDAGNFTINAPSSGIALTVTQQGTNNCINFGATGNAINGVGDIAFDTSGNMYFGNGTSNTSLNLGSFSAGTSTNLLTAGNNRLSVSSTGNVTINAPSSGTTLTLAGVSSTNPLNVYNNAASNVNIGYFSNTNAAGTANIQVAANNGVVLGYLQADTGGAVEFGSITNHAVQFRVNGSSLVAQITTGLAFQYNLDAAGTYWELGTRDIPQNIQGGNYTLALTDRGKEIYCTNAGAQAITIPANASIAFPVGAVVSITNMGTTAITIPITTDTLNWSPGGTTGTRTLAKFGTCVLKKMTSTTWLISGTGLT